MMAAPENLLAQETSPYLLQHADNPVHWRPWGKAALDEAQAANKPIMVSIGYAACHWCHVMAHESFEDPETAALMNSLFVNIKIDREERPDIDHIYMSALHALGEQGGWPLTMFTTPDGTPFWGGTYFPPEPRWGRPSFRQVLQGVANAFHTGAEAVTQNTRALTQFLEQQAAASVGDAPGPAHLDAVAQAYLRMTDPEHGGLRGAPKFPNPPIYRFLWQNAFRTGQPEAGEAPAPDAGAHVAGRHLRPPRRRLCPLLHRRHLAGAALREDALRQCPVAGTAGAGACPSAQPALRPAGGGNRRLDDARHERAADRRQGRLRGVGRCRQRGRGRPLLRLDRGRGRCAAGPGRGRVQAGLRRHAAAATGKATPSCAASRRPARPTRKRLWPSAREMLFQAREKRVRPGWDDKVLADWNGLAIAALARAAVVFDQPAWLDRAQAGVRLHPAPTWPPATAAWSMPGASAGSPRRG